MSEQEELRRSIDQLRSSLDTVVAQLVRRDVYDSDQRGVAASIKTVDDDVKRLEKRQDKVEENTAANKRLMIASFASPLLLLGLQLYLRSQGVS